MERNPRFTSTATASHTSGLNVTLHRAPQSIWDRRGWDGSRTSATATRWLVGGGGLALMLQGMRQKGFTRTVLTGIGGTLAWWAVTGDGELPEVRRWVDVIAERITGRAADPVHDASADSFPASDAPSFTPTIGTGVRHGTQ